MSRRAPFQQSDITRAFKGAAAAGVTPTILIRPDGTMVIMAANDPVLPASGGDLDSRLDAFGSR